MMAVTITFHGWQRPAVGGLVDGVEQGRPRIRSTVELHSLDAEEATRRTATVRLTALLAGPGDVTALQPGAVTGRFPAPGTPDADTTICPHAELADPGLPWRYTPQANPPAGDQRLRPWLALLVGTDDELTATGGTVTVDAVALREHPLRFAATWAHVQHAGGHRLARLVCRRPLRPRTRYLAVVVPTYAVLDGELGNAWGPNQQDPVTLPAYARWRFRTGPGGDFRTLADDLRPGRADASTGRTAIRYPRLPDVPPLPTGGALVAVGGAGDDLPQAVRGDLAALRTADRDPDGRRIIGLPTYGGAWHADPDGTAWGGPLNADPRHRGVAGLGLRLGVELQEELAERVAEQAGPIDTVAERVRHLSLGLAAAGALWRRRLPVDAGRRLWLFGPALPRVTTAAGQVAALATAEDRPLARGWFTPAVRRALRRGPARTALARPIAADPGRLNRVANRPPVPAPSAEVGLPPFAALDAADFDSERADIVAGGPADASGFDEAFRGLEVARFGRHAERLISIQAHTETRRGRGRPMPWVPLTLLLAALGDGEDDSDFDEEAAAPLLAALAADFEPLNDTPDVLPDLLRDLGDEQEPPPPSRPLDLDRMGAELTAAFDPTGADAQARRRVLATVTGLGPTRPLAPPEPCPSLDVPVWRKLAELAPDWLLPGVGQLVEDAVIAVGTNPVFVDAFLTGLNTRLLEEVRWRNLRVASGCTPIRTFWHRADVATGARVDDITGIQRWTPGSVLGDPQHRPAGVSGSDLVLVFRSTLFQRYPNTLLYLVSARHGGRVDFDRFPADGAPRTLPTFQGRVGADVTFFGFVGVPATDAAALWVALEEPPTGFRFRNDRREADLLTDGAAFADAAFADPVRVLIQGDHLVPGAAS